MPVGARTRVAERLRQEAHRREALSGFRFRWLPALTFAAGAALVLLVVGLGLRTGSQSAHDPASTAVLGIFAVEGEGCSHHVDAGDTVLDGICRLVASSMAVQTWDRVVLREEDGIRVLEGAALFDVNPVDPGKTPVRILVSHGAIEVLGTRFAIDQGPRGGHVDLFEGMIRFVPSEGESSDIEPGQRYSWGEGIASASLAVIDARQEPQVALDRPAAIAPPVVLEAPSSKRRAKSTRRRSAEAVLPKGDAADANAIIIEVTRLRTQGRYADAAAVLRQAERSHRWDRRTAQVLSYELGQIVERHLGDDEVACVYWTRHERRFPGGRYAKAVAAARERLACQSDPSR